MSDEEVLSFLDEQRTVVCATNGRDGWPHLMPLWYLVRNRTLWAWTYAKSQKVRNLERDARATMQVETGEQYHELRGVMLRTEAVIHRDPGVIEAYAMDMLTRYMGTGADIEPARELFRGQVPKRVALEFREQSRVSWDHAKLGATY